MLTHLTPEIVRFFAAQLDGYAIGKLSQSLISLT